LHTPTNSFFSTTDFPSFNGLDNIEFCRCKFRSGNYDDSLYSRHAIDFPACIRKSIRKRKSEFLAGRYAAQHALYRIGVNELSIGIGLHRNPVWPDGILGSITHNDDTAICAIARSSHVSALGIDLETHIKAQIINDIKHSIIDFSEERMLRQLPIPFDTAFTIAFSAKESLFKALYPHVGTYFTFSSAKIGQLNPHHMRFSISLQHDLNEDFHQHRIIDGQYIINSRDVLTIISISELSSQVDI